MNKTTRKPLKTAVILYSVFLALSAVLLIIFAHVFNSIYISCENYGMMFVSYFSLIFIIALSVLILVLLPLLICTIISMAHGKSSKFLDRFSIVYAPLVALVIIPLIILGIIKTVSFSATLNPDDLGNLIVNEINIDEDELGAAYVSQATPFGEEIQIQFSEHADENSVYYEYNYHKITSPIMKNKKEAFSEEEMMFEDGTEKIKGDGYTLYATKSSDYKDYIAYRFVIDNGDELFYASYDAWLEANTYEPESFAQECLSAYNILKNPEQRPQSEYGIFGPFITQMEEYYKAGTKNNI